jgi:hypothetical protein
MDIASQPLANEVRFSRHYQADDETTFLICLKLLGSPNGQLWCGV